MSIHFGLSGNHLILVALGFPTCPGLQQVLASSVGEEAGGMLGI